MSVTTDPGPEPTSRSAPGRHGARLLEQLPQDGSRVSLAEHRRFHPRPPDPRSRPWHQLTEVVEDAGLRGRGGGSFPTATKMRAVAARGGRPVVVVNASEGEPLSAKDSLLLTRLPHLILDGAALAATAVGAGEVVVCVKRSSAASARSLDQALEERRGEGGPAIRAAIVPDRYVAGEESALVRWLNGGPAKPTVVPPRPFERGVGGRPTLVQNAETLAHVAQIAVYGADWFRDVGTDDEPGTALFTVSGGVRAPGVVEAPFGTRLSALVDAAAPTSPVSAVLVGGYSGSWL